MPFTPFHLGPALFFGFLLSAVFDLPTFLIASVLPDIEPFAVSFFGIHGYPFHGFFHSYIGATILSLVLAFDTCFLKGFFGKVMMAFRIQQHSSLKKIIFTIINGLFHVFLDSFLYSEMMPFYPLQGNVFSAYGSSAVIYGFCDFAAF
ncbi:MAG: hypothetical protein N3E52_02670 [Candidatus Bathyarchaeota archaeon]|nr:hypothetical protein [Candidatus Bathyarchaeota archaeon]